MKIRKLAMAIGLQAFALSGCYIVPTGQDGNYGIYIPSGPGPVPPPAAQGASQPGLPKVLTARLYPDNELATQTGMVSGTVTNMMTGKGRFQLNYRGETLSGEATRVDGDSRRGVASAHGSGGSYMSCEYQMRTPQQGAGTCQFSNGAKYQVHIGS